jgi:hypothetical protein
MRLNSRPNCEREDPDFTQATAIHHSMMDTLDACTTGALYNLAALLFARAVNSTDAEDANRYVADFGYALQMYLRGDGLRFGWVLNEADREPTTI